MSRNFASSAFFELADVLLRVELNAELLDRVSCASRKSMCFSSSAVNASNRFLETRSLTSSQ